MPSKPKSRPLSKLKLFSYTMLFAAIGIALLQISNASTKSTLTDNPMHILVDKTSAVPGDEIVATIGINSKGKSTYTANAVVVYPLDRLQLLDEVDVSQSSFSEGLASSSEPGRVEVSRVNFEPLSGGDLVLAKLRFKVVGSQGGADISFDRGTSLIDASNNSNLYKSGGDASVVISVKDSLVSEGSSRIVLQASSTDVSKGERIFVDVLADTDQSLLLSQVDAVLSYDSQTLKLENIDTQESVFGVGLESLDDGGRITISRRQDEDFPIGTQAKVAELEFVVLGDAGATELTVDDGSQVTSATTRRVVKLSKDKISLSLSQPEVANSAPVFIAPYEIEATENSTVAGVISATDKEGEAFSLAIVGGDDRTKFKLESSTGVYEALENSANLLFSPTVNYEEPTDVGQDNRYEVVVSATDSDGNSSSQQYVVVIGDSPELPYFTSKTVLGAKSIVAPENQAYVTTLRAEDQDQNASVAYEIVDSSDSAWFSINPLSGVLSFAREPDFEAPGDLDADNVYEVTVVVDDPAARNPEQADRLTLLVTVDDIEDDVHDSEKLVVDAGGDTSIDLGTSINRGLNGTSNIDNTDFSWSVISGPRGGAGIAGRNAANPKLTITRPGVYVLKVDAAVGDLRASDTVVVTASDTFDSSDSDNISDAAEEQLLVGAAGGVLDGNNDQVPDSLQDNVATNVYVAAGGEVEGANHVTMESSGCQTIHEFNNVTESDFDIADADNYYEFGLFELDLGCPNPGELAELKIYIPGRLKSENRWRVFDEYRGRYIDFSDDVSYSNTEVKGVAFTVASMTISDGGAYEVNSANDGRIKLAIGPATPGDDNSTAGTIGSPADQSNISADPSGQTDSQNKTWRVVGFVAMGLLGAALLIYWLQYRRS